MTTTSFDPVFSAALRTELAALAEQEHAGAGAGSPRTTVLRRPQVWVSVATALVLLAATLGLLRLTSAPDRQAASSADIADPLDQITDAGSPEYVGAAPLVLLHESGTGSGSFSIEVPSGVASARPYIRCAPLAGFRITVGKGFSSGCDARSADFADIPVTTGREDVVVRIPAGVRWKLVVIATPDGSTTTDSTLRVTTAPDAIVDPLSEITDPSSDLYVAHAVTPILHERQSRSRRYPLAVPPGTTDVRVYLVCAPGADWSLDGSSGTCRGRISSFVDEAVSDLHGGLQVTVPDGTPYVLLVIPTPSAASGSTTFVRP